jgi:GNAT superfamily N-acetyltransferase
MKKDGNYTYRFMEKGEEKEVYDLILQVFHKFVAPTYSQKGIETFLDMVSPKALCEANKGKNSFVIIAEHRNRPIGMLAIRKDSHIALIFVDSKYQGKGVGKHLLDEAIKICLNRNSDLTEVTVSSSPNSMRFYEGVGFEAQGIEVDQNGMRFTPMRKIIK